MAVQENLEMGAYINKEVSQEDLEMVFNYFPRLKERRKQIAGTLSGGEQQMLAMSRALMSHPKLMMLDEPSMGLAPLLVDQIFEIIKELHKAGTTILLVEQNARKALQIADRAYVLETGGITLAGVLIANSKNQAVIETKVEELTREVREHNNFARRMPVVEEQIKVINHRIDDLEGYHKPEK
jgi:branched-chain amino acid transport system ATP-binding protein